MLDRDPPLAPSSKTCFFKNNTDSQIFPGFYHGFPGRRIPTEEVVPGHAPQQTMIGGLDLELLEYKQSPMESCFQGFSNVNISRVLIVFFGLRGFVVVTYCMVWEWVSSVLCVFL